MEETTEMVQGSCRPLQTPSSFREKMIKGPCHTLQRTNLFREEMVKGPCHTLQRTNFFFFNGGNGKIPLSTYAEDYLFRERSRKRLF